jgi:hypothetical protein
MSRTYPRGSSFQSNKILLSKLSRRARARRLLKKAQVKKKLMIVMMKAPSMILKRWLSL